MDFRSIDIHTLLPQQPPFVMVGYLTNYEDTRNSTETLIKEDNIFVENGVFTEPGILENIAQTCAARIGYYNVYIKKDNIIRIGYIGAIKDMKILDLPKVGETITTQIEVLYEIGGMILAHATVDGDERRIAEGDLKIALADGTKNS